MLALEAATQYVSEVWKVDCLHQLIMLTVV